MSNCTADRPGKLIAVCGDAASGKSTLARAAAAAYPESLEYMRTCTTRTRRPGEDDFEYDFVSDEEYERLAARARHWDGTEIYGNKYGNDAAKYIAKLSGGLSLMVCTLPSSQILAAFSEIYPGSDMRVVCLDTDAEVREARLAASRPAREVGRVALDAAQRDRMIIQSADAVFVPTGELAADRLAFVEIVGGIIDE